MTSVVVLPEGRIQEVHLKNLCALFHEVHVAMPSLMNPTSAMEEAARLGFLHIHRPQQTHGQEPALKSLLREYKNLALSSGEGGLSSYLKSLMLVDKEETRWDVSQRIKTMTRKTSETQDTEPLYLQVLLHLYQHVQESRNEAAIELESLEKSGSPLAEALGQEESLPLPDSDDGTDYIEVPLDETTLREVLRAWMALFPILAEASHIIAALNPEIFYLISGEFEEAINSDIASARPLEVKEISLQGFSSLPWKEFNSAQIQELRDKSKGLFDLASAKSGPNTDTALEENPTYSVNHMTNYSNKHGGYTIKLRFCKLPVTRKDLLKAGFLASLSDKILLNMEV